MFSAILKTNIGKTALPNGFSAAALDYNHTLVWATDHPIASTQVTQSEFDGFVADYATVDNHDATDDINAEITISDSHPKVDASTYPDTVVYDGTDLSAEAHESDRGVVVWDSL
jgi:hypothetical protein